MKTLQHYKHFIGCDVSKNTLDFAIFQAGKEYRTFEHIQVPNTLDGFREVRKWLGSFKVKKAELVFGLEYTGVYSNEFTDWCFKKGYAFVMLHPMDVKNACSRGRNKTDMVDAQFIADYIYLMRERLETSTPESPVIKQLRDLYNERALAVKTRTMYINQSKTLNDKASINRVKKTLETLSHQIKSIEAQILSVLNSDENLKNNYDLLLSIPGIGLVNAVQTIISTGNFTRFRNARQYAKFSCVSPMHIQSGTSVKGGCHVSRIGHNEIKSVLTEAARSAVTHDKQMRAYYERKRKEGKSHGCVMNAVKFKLICRMFAVITRQSKYVDIDKYRS